MVLLLLQSIFPFTLLPQPQPGGSRTSKSILPGRIQVPAYFQKGPLSTSLDLLGRHFPHHPSKLPSLPGLAIELQPLPSLQLLQPLLLLALPFELIFPSLLGVRSPLLRSRRQDVGPQPMFYHFFGTHFPELIMHSGLGREIRPTMDS